MSNIVAADEAQEARATNVALWSLQAVLAFQFAGGGLLKLTGSPEMIAWGRRSRTKALAGWLQR